MSYWRMQLHPARPRESAKYAADSICRGFIGLDFREDVGDLRGPTATVETGQRDFLKFESEMRVGDLVLVQCHHYPFALVEVASDYLYVKEAPAMLGVWFRHLRAIKNTSLYSDYVTNPKNWERIPMTDTISPLHDESGAAYRLIARWSQEFQS